MLPYNGKQGNKLLSKIKHLNKSLPTVKLKQQLKQVKITVTYQSKRLGTKFQLKYKTKFHQQNNLVYYINVRIKHAMKITSGKQKEE